MKSFYIKAKVYNPILILRYSKDVDEFYSVCVNEKILSYRVVQLFFKKFGGNECLSKIFDAFGHKLISIETAVDYHFITYIINGSLNSTTNRFYRYK